MKPRAPWHALRIVLFWVLAVAALLHVYLTFVPYALALNTTASIPRGLYLSKLAQGSVLEKGQAVCFAYRAPAWAANRAYFEEGRRLCKFVAGLPGDRVEVSGGVLTVFQPDESRPSTSADLSSTDSKGRPLPANALISGGIPPGQVLLLAPANPNSLDSRYLGLIPREQVSHLIWPLWVERHTP